MKIRAVSSALCLALLCLPAMAAEEKSIQLASLEWLPYVGASLPEQGLSSFIAASALKRLGQQFKIAYFPWKRAMQVGSTNAAFAGYFPAYYTKERALNCHFSQALGSSSIGLAYLKSNPLQWESVDDLSQLGASLGVVFAYSNGERFDTLVKQGRIHIESSASDQLNLRKLMMGRVRAAVVDEAVLRYLLKTDPVLSTYSNQIVFHPRPLAELKLYICFQRNAQGLANKTAFDQALQELNLRKLEEEYFQILGAQSAHPQPAK